MSRTDIQRRFLIVGVLGLLIAGFVARPGLTQSSTAAATGEELGHVRFERGIDFPDDWVASAESDSRNRVVLFEGDVATPTSADRVDVVATVSMDYRMAGSRDRGDVRLDFTPAGGSGDSTSMRPGPFKFSGLGDVTDSRTFVWSKQDVVASGAVYSFQLETGVIDGPDRGQTARSSGHLVSIVIEMWPSD